jgi:hypothetical protein
VYKNGENLSLVWDQLHGVNCDDYIGLKNEIQVADIAK